MPSVTQNTETEKDGEVKVNGGSEAPTPGEKPKIMLIPWDPESEEQCERLRLLRVACGWKADKVQKWRVCQREGTMNLHWAVLAPDEPHKAFYITKHLARYPSDSTPLHDTATCIGGRPRSSTSARSLEPFIPLGKISIDLIASTPVQDKMLADPDAHRFHISAFYVSRALHGSGIGRITMEAAESMAVRVLGAKCLTLDTLDKMAMFPESEGGIPGALDAITRLGPKIKPLFSTQEWYERMGYGVVKRVREWDPKSSYVIRGEEREGVVEEYCLPSVWMEKVLV